MSTVITFPEPDGADYVIPAVGDENWGQNVTNFLVAIPSGVMPRSGLFTLTGDVGLGTSFGLILQYLKSVQPNIATSGFMRLAVSDAVSWRNNANTGNLPLAVNGSDQLTFNGVPIVSGTVVTSVSGTANKITASPTTGDVVLDITDPFEVGQIWSDFVQVSVAATNSPGISVISPSSPDNQTGNLCSDRFSLTDNNGRIAGIVQHVNQTDGDVTMSLPRQQGTAAGQVLTLTGSFSPAETIWQLPSAINLSNMPGTPPRVLLGTATGISAVVGFGTTGQALLSNGTGVAPTWQNVAGSGTVNSGTAGHLVWYPSSGTTVGDAASQNITGEYTFENNINFELSTNIFDELIIEPTAILALSSTAQLLFDDGVGNALTIVSPSLYSASYTWTLPTTQGIASSVLANNGSGVLSFVSNLLMGAGSAGTPSYSFTSNTNSGMFDDGLGGIGFSAGGTKRFSIDTGDVKSTVFITAPTVLCTGASVAAGGSSLELLFSSGSGIVQPFDRTGSAYLPLQLLSSTLLYSYDGGAHTVISAGSAGVAILGTNTNDSVATGFVGEYVVSTVGSTSVPASGAYGDLTSISLTAGDWDVTGCIVYAVNSATYTSYGIEAGTSTTSGNSATGLVTAVNWVYLYETASVLVSSGNVPLTIPSHRLSLATTTTVYLKMMTTVYTAGTPKAYGSISARRAR